MSYNFVLLAVRKVNLSVVCIPIFQCMAKYRSEISASPLFHMMQHVPVFLNAQSVWQIAERMFELNIPEGISYPF